MSQKIETEYRPPVPKGTSFARAVIALAKANGSVPLAKQYASYPGWRTTPGLDQAIEALEWAGAAPLAQLSKSAVPGGDTQDTQWAAPLGYQSFAATQYSAILRAGTIAGRLALRRVPMNVKYPKQTATATVGWVAEGSGVAVSSLAFQQNTLGISKYAAMLVLTNDLFRFGNPDVEQLVNDELTRSGIEFADRQFIDPNVAAVANVSPASITNGITPIQSTGSTAVQIATDLEQVAGALLDNNEADSLAWIMTRRDMIRLAMKRDSQGSTAFEEVAENGTYAGIPIIASNAVPHSVSAGSIVALVNASGIDYAELDGLIGVAVSQEASVQMDSAPSQSSISPVASNVVSLFQVNATAVLLTIYANWKRVRDTAVMYLDNCHWG